MNGGYVLFDVKAIDFTSTSKQTSVLLYDRAVEIFNSGKPVLVYGVPSITPIFAVLEKGTGAFKLSFIIACDVYEIAIESTGTTVAITDVKPVSSND